MNKLSNSVLLTFLKDKNNSNLFELTQFKLYLN